MDIVITLVIIALASVDHCVSYRTQSAECYNFVVSHFDKVPCGGGFLGPTECARAGCCYDDLAQTSHAGNQAIPRCYSRYRLPATTAPQPTVPQGCQIPYNQQKRFCGDRYITSTECQRRGCCYDSAPLRYGTNTPVCYMKVFVQGPSYSQYQVQPTYATLTQSLPQARYRFPNPECAALALPEPNRVECGYPGITSIECNSNGCCYDDLDDSPYRNSQEIPFCYQKYPNFQTTTSAPVILTTTARLNRPTGGPLGVTPPTGPIFPSGSFFGSQQQTAAPVAPVRPASNNMENLFSYLGIDVDLNNQNQGQTNPNRVPPGQGALGTNVAPSIQQNIISSVGNPCSLAVSIQDEAIREKWVKDLNCIGNEPKVDKAVADAAVKDLIASLGIVPTAAAPTRAPAFNLFGQPQGAGQTPVGAQLPNFSGANTNNNVGPNSAMCKALAAANLGDAGKSIADQFRCNTSPAINPLLSLLGGGGLGGSGGLGGLSGLPSLLSLFGQTTSTTSTGTGAINPIMLSATFVETCIADRHKYPTCKKGIYSNIRSDNECLNIGCIPYRDACFACPNVPKEAYIAQGSADTCAVEKSARQKCEAYDSFLLTSTLFGGGFGGSSGLGGFGGLGGLGALGGGLGGLGSLLGSRSLPAQPQAQPQYSERGTSLSNRMAPQTRQLNTNLLSLLGGGAGGSNNLYSSLLQGLGGSSSSPSSSLNTNLFSSLLGGAGATTPSPNIFSSLLGGSGGASNPLASLGGLFGGDSGSNDRTKLHKSQCESNGCCWVGGGLFGGECYAKGKVFAKDCIPAKNSGTCGKSPAGIISRIIGGTGVGSNTYRPWMALIKTKGISTIRCGGVLICSQWVLTTASCLKRQISASGVLLDTADDNVDTLDMWLGTINPDNPDNTGTKVAIKAIHPFGTFSFRQSYNDIALIRIEELPYTSQIKPACLPTIGGKAPTENTPVYLTGYGRSGALFQQPLREARFLATTYSQCDDAYPGAVPRSGVFCAKPGKTGDDSCIGDGGGPAMIYDADAEVYTVVGLNFGGSDGCDSSKPALFTDVGFFMYWIAQTTNGCCSLFGDRSG